MKRKISRILAIMMAFMVVVTSTVPADVFAAQVEDSTVNAENTVSENGQDTAQALEMADEEIIFENDTDTFGEKGKLNFLYLENKYIESPGEQNVLIGYGDEETVLTSAKLEVQNYRTKEISSYYSEETMDNTVLFNMGFSPEDAGIYEITGVSFVTEDGEEKHVSLSETGMAKVYFGVDEEVIETGDITAEPDASVEMQIVTFDEEGVSDVEAEEITAAVEDALNEAENNVNAMPKGMASYSAVLSLASEVDANGRSANGDIVVVLDPGHDATHAGARANGLSEETLTLKIAQYCKEELEQYSGVKVYMTRSSDSCPYPGTSSTDDNKRRVDYAKSVGADIYVSIHLNSSTNASAHGAEVFYPNSNYNSSIGSQGASLATQISRQLVALGLNNRGITIRNSEDKTTYPDGSLADYYGVIKNSKLAGFPAVIVEHAFLTNASDAAFLSSEANLKKLGIADATGIANYLGVSKTINIKSNAPTVQKLNNGAGTFTASVTGVTPVSSVSSVRFAVWSTANGQDDLKWYTAVNAGNGTFTANINISNHKSEAGAYNVHVYAYDNKGGSHFLGAAECIFAKVPMSISSMNTSISNDGKTMTVTAAGVLGVGTMRFAVWSAVNGQDDLIWYTAKDNGNGTWTAVVPISAHKGSAGTYYVHAYGQNIYTTNQFLKDTTFKVEGPKVGTVKTSDVDSGAGTFTVRVEGSSAIAGIGSVRVAVWSKADQSNLVWYTAAKKGDGIYEVPVDISKHGYQYGTYTVHAYVTDNNGLTAIAGTTCNMKQPVAVVTATGNGNQTQFNVKASNVGYAGGVKGVRFAVWSTAGGQDDLVWYTGANNGSGVWSANVKVANHKTAGTYNVHMYITDQNGSTHLGGSTTFTVEGPKAGTVKTSNVDSSAGTFTVRLEGSSAIAGIGSVRVAVWSKADQSNLVWYTATKKADGVYEVPVDISKHGYQYGVYTVHAYVTDNNGLTAIAGTTCNMKQPVAVVTATRNGNQTQFNVKASNVGYAGGVKGVRFAVWSTTGGQDDLVWYTG
ncbi:MAG: hypothetical protein HDR00_15765, partial [Lachnospiraceae bacterium]|nr:hypothetical protein [Lachnospiraceae bacterium]